MWNPDILICWSERDCKEAEEWLMNSILISNDIETIPKLGLMSVNGYSGLHSNGMIRTFVFPIYLNHSNTSGTPQFISSMLRVMSVVNESGIPFVFQNGAYDLSYHIRYGMPVANYAYDTMVMFWSLYPELDKDLGFIGSIYLLDYQYWKGGRKSDDWTTHLMYNGRDCYNTIRLCMILIQELLNDPRAAVNFWRAHMRVLSSLSMSMRGLRSDELRMADHHLNLVEDAVVRLRQFRELIADPGFNVNSAPQKKELFYKKLGVKFRTDRGKATKKYEDASTGAMALKVIKSDHPLYRRIINGLEKAMEPSKQISNVVGIVRNHWTPSNIRFHTSYNGVGATTERLASSKTPFSTGGNAQNIRKKYRSFISADPNSFLLDIDFSAADDVFVTFESGEPKKIELFRSGKDGHAYNATVFFDSWTYDRIVAGKKAKDTDYALYESVTHPITGIRQITKKISHGCNYLMAANTLLVTVGRDAIIAAARAEGIEDAGTWDQERLIKFCESREARYRNHYPRFKRSGEGSFYSELREQLIRTGGFTTPFGYYQRFLGDAWEDGVLRAVAATAGQAGTAGRINMAMAELDLGFRQPEFRDGPNPHYDREVRQISESLHGISLRLQTHDSLTWNVNYTHPNWEQGVAWILEVMQRPVVIRNPLTGLLEEFVVGNEPEVGYYWGEGMKEVKGPLNRDSIEKMLTDGASFLSLAVNA